MIDDLTRSVLEQRDNIENQRNREIKSNEESYIKRLEQENKQLKEDYETLHNKFINYLDKQDFAKLCKISRPYLDKLLKGMNRQQIYKYCETRNKIKEIGG